MTVPSVRRLRSALIACALPLALAACGQPQRAGDADLQLKWSFEPDPPTVGVAAIRLDVSDVGWNPRNGARVILTGLRDGVALEVDTARGEGAGSYLAADFRFEVAGSWVVRARVESADGSWTEEEYPLEVVAPER